MPVGLKDEMGTDTVKIFCPKCQCVYHPPPIRSHSSSHHGAGAAGVDGAAFGTTFPHLFLMTFSNLVPDPLPPNSAYVPRVFGFRVHMSARQRTPSNAAASGDAAGKSSAKNSRLTYTRKSSAQGATAASAAAATAATANDSKAAKWSDQDAKPAALNAAKASHSGLANSTATTTTKTSPDGTKPGEDDNDGKDDAKNVKPRAGTNKRRADGDDSTSRSKDGNGFLIDSASKRRKRGDVPG